MSSNTFELIEALRVSIDQLNQIMLGGETDTVTISGVTKPSISKRVAELYAQIEADVAALQAGQAAAVVGKATLADLNASLNHPDGTIAYVTNDTTAANNGVYRKVGASGSGSWTMSSSDRVSAVEQRLNNYQVSFFGDVVVDRQAGVVRYPRMAVMRNGQSWKDCNPATHSLTAFELPIDTTTGNNRFHYVDASLIGSATVPVKSEPSTAIPARTLDIVPLGTSVNGRYQCFWSSNVVYTDRPAVLRVASMKKPVLLDRNNRLGGGPAVYVPIGAGSFYINVPAESVSSSQTPANAASTELAGYAKLALASASPASVHSVYYDRTLSQFAMAVYGVLPEGDTASFIPVVDVWADTFRVHSGFQVLSYDDQQLDNVRWPTVCMFNKRLVWDPSGYLGGGAALYVPRWIFIQRGGAVTSLSALMTESSELAGYVKLARPGSASVVSAVLFNAATQQLEWNAYGTSLDLKTALLDKVHLIAEFWDGGAIKTPYNWRDPRQNLGENQTAYGKLADQMPRRYSTTTVVDITEPNLLALGFTRGAADLTANNRPYFGDNFKSYTPKGKGFFRFYLETDTPDSYGTPRVHLWNSLGSYYTVTPTMEKRLSANAAMFSVAVEALPDDANMSFFYVGSDTQTTSPAVRVKITGVQYHSSALLVEGIPLTSYPESVVADASTVEGRDAANVARSNALRQRLVTTVQRPTAKYNTKVVYGQSLGRGQETSPSLSRTNRFGNLTLGANVLPNTNDGANYSPFTSATLQPLVAQAVDGATVYAYGSEPAGAFGEPVNHGWVNFAKYLHNQEALAENDASRLFVTFNPSVSGKTIEQLSKVNTQDATNRYSRYTDGLSKIEAATGSDTHVVDGIMWMQGEWNYYSNGGSWDKATYKTLFNQLITDMVADAMAITGQGRPPAFFTYQTGAAYTRDVDSAGVAGLHVGMAQLEVALEREGVWMVGPVYQYTDKGGHLTANGSRWFANQIAKVYHQVVRLGRDWEPLRPIRVAQSGRTVDVDFHVPSPPLVFDLPYLVQTATDYAAKGFKVTDSSGTVPISSVSIVGNTVVRLALGRDTNGQVYVWYADKTVHNGNGCLRDSDPTVALDNYVYRPEDGMGAGENIASLVDKPYPLHNWCVAFYLPVGYDEA